MIFKKSKIIKIVKYLLKFTFIIFSVFYIIFTALYINFSHLSQAKKIETLNNLLHDYITNGCNFNIKSVTYNKNKINIDIENIIIKNKSYSNFIINIPNINLSISPYYIFILKNPIYFSILNNMYMQLPIEMLNSDTSESKNKTQIKYLQTKEYVYNIITTFPKYIQKIIKNGLKVEKTEIDLIFKNNFKEKILLKNLTIKPNKLLFYRKLYISYQIKINETTINSKNECLFSFTFKPKKCNIHISAKNISSVSKDIGNIYPILNKIPIIDDVNMELSINFENDIFIPLIKIFAQNTFIKINNKAVEIKNLDIQSSLLKDVFSIMYAQIIIDNVKIESQKDANFAIQISDDIKALNAFIVNVNHADFNNISKIWPNEYLHEVKQFITQNKIQSEEIKAKFSIENKDWNIDIHVKELTILLDKILSQTNAKDIQISVNKNKVSINAPLIDNNLLKIFKTKIDINYENHKNIYMNIDISNIRGSVGNILQNLHNINKDIYSFSTIVNESIFGYKCKENCSNFELNNTKVFIPLTFDKSFIKNIAIESNGKIDIGDTQFFEKQYLHSANLNINKEKNSDNFKIIFDKLNQSKIYIFNNNEQITKLDTNISYKESVNIESNLFTNKGKVLTAIVNPQKDQLDIKITTNRDIENYININLHSDSNKIDLRGKISNVNFKSMLQESLHFPKSNTKSQISEFDIDLDIAKINLLNDITLQSLLFQLKTNNKYYLKNLSLYLKAVDKDGNFDELSINKNNAKDDNIFTIKGNKLINLLNGLMVNQDLLYIKNLNGSFESLDNLIIFNLQTDKVVLKIPIDNSLKSSAIKVLMPSFSIGKNALSYTKISLDGKAFLSENSIIFNIDDFFAKSSISKITTLGYYDVTNEYLSIEGKINTAYKINRILTAEDIPALNKILTLGNKDGGYGVINYTISDKISNINEKSVKISGDRSNLIIASGLISVNPLLAIPIVFTSKDVKG